MIGMNGILPARGRFRGPHPTHRDSGVWQIRDLIVEINEQGTSVLLVEQNAVMALSISSHGYVMETGKIVMDSLGVNVAHIVERALTLLGG